MQPRARRVRSIALLAAAALVAGGAGAAAWHYSQRLPKRFAVVAEGRLYRSGGLTPAQLEHVAARYGIRRVVCLLNPAAPQTQAEQAAAQRLGLAWYNVPLPGNGASTADERRQILALLADPAAGPTLVHCAAGVNRTGLAVGLYRLHVQGWSLAKVLVELRTFDFEDEPQHANLRAALAEEAAAAASAR